MSILEQTERIAFGLFEVDPRAGELWKAGYKVRLASQPFKVLTALLSKPGEVVSREELQLQVWGANTNVDFERAVAGAINKIREALGDSAENPRFIQTLPKRGYRFIAPVGSVPSSSKDLSPVKPTVNQTSVSTGETELSSPDDTAKLAAPMAPPVGSILLSGNVSSLDTGSSVERGWTVAQAIGGGLAGLVLCLALLVLLLRKEKVDPAPLRVDQLTHSEAISAGPPSLENLLTLATDGNRILTSVMEGGRPHLSAISLSTGEVEAIALPQELASSLLADISKDGSKLLLKSHLSSASEQPLWIVPSSGGSALRVGSVLAHDAAWMPDGTSVLYGSGNDLTVIRLDNGISTPFARLKGRAFWMRWSPDGEVLRFTLLDPVTHSFSLWELPKKSGAPRPIHTSQAELTSACCGSWTADGSAYVFESEDNLWQLRGNGRTASLSQLTNGPLRFLSPVTARAGSRVFFVGMDQTFGLQQFAEKEGFHPAPLFLANATRVDFSRDGVWVAWTGDEGKLWRARASDGSDKVQLTPDYIESFMARWSPDGRQLAVMAREPGKVWRIYLIDANGGTPEPLLKEERNAADPSWSADGKSLVFGREPDLMGKESGSHTIQIVDLATRKTEIVPGSEGMFSPRWSPDGRWIAALSLNQKSLMLFDVAEQRWKELAKTSAADPSWSADSKSVYVHAFLEDKQPILRVGVPNGDVHVVTDLSGFHDRATVNYFFGGLTLKNDLLVQPRIGTGDLFTLNLKVR